MSIYGSITAKGGCKCWSRRWLRRTSKMLIGWGLSIFSDVYGAGERAGVEGTVLPTSTAAASQAFGLFAAFVVRAVDGWKFRVPVYVPGLRFWLEQCERYLSHTALARARHGNEVVGLMSRCHRMRRPPQVRCGVAYGICDIRDSTRGFATPRGGAQRLSRNLAKPWLRLGGRFWLEKGPFFVLERLQPSDACSVGGRPVDTTRAD
jgi:hypothetical protein